MRITASVAGILLIAAVAVAQDDSTATEAVTQDGSKAVAPVAVVLDSTTIAEQVEAAQKHVAIGSVVSKEATNKKTGAQTQTIKVISEQDANSPFVGTMRLTIEMEANGNTIWYGQQSQVQKKRLKTNAGSETSEIDYTGEDTWTFKIPIGKGTDMERATVKGYAVEYGFVASDKASGGKAASNQFVVVAAKYNQVENADEIMARNQGSPNVIKIKSSGKALKEGEGAGDKGGGGK